MMAGILMFPVFALAQSSSLHVDQPIGTNDTNNPGNIQITDVTVAPQDNQAVISWQTAGQTIAQLSWGKTRDYRDGVISEQQYASSHSVTLPGLTAATTYYFFILAGDSLGRHSSYTGEFRTENILDNVPPYNVAQFQAIPLSDRIVLSWKNPPNLDFAAVRVVRSEKFFPFDITNGTVIYEGTADHFEDTKVNPGIVYYYSIFSRDQQGNYSSGSINSAMILWYSDPPVVDLGLPKPLTLPDKQLSINNFRFTYRDSGILIPDLQALMSNQAIQIEIAEAQLPEEVAYLLVTIKNTALGTKAIYLFSHDTVNHRFVYIVSPFSQEFSGLLTISLLNRAKFITQEVAAPIMVRPLLLSDAVSPTMAPQSGLPSVATIWWFIILAILLIILYLWYLIKQREKK